ncbi:MAG: oligosaccharide flippase family protein [Bacteroidota bacterium]
MKINIKIGESSYAMLSTLAAMMGNLLVMLMLVRYFSQEDFGQWVLYLSLFTLAEMARTGIVQNGMVKFTQSNPNDYKEILTAAVMLHMVLGLGLWLVLVVISFPLAEIWKSPALIELSPLYGLTFITLGSLRFGEYVQMANQDFKGVFWGNGIFALTYSAIIGVLFVGNFIFDWADVLYIQAGAALLGALFVWNYRKSMFQFGAIRWVWIARLFHYGKFSLGTNLSSMLLQRVDIALLGYFVNPAAVASYNIASRAPNYMEVPLKGGAQYFFPKIASAYRNGEGKERAARLYEEALGMMLAINIPLCVGAFIFAKPILYILGGPDYLGAQLILWILLANTLIKPFARMFGTVLDAIGKPEVNFKLVFFSILLNLVANLIFIPIWGGVGAAVGTILAMILMNLVSFGILKDYIPFQLNALPNWIMFYYKKWWAFLPFNRRQPTEKIH